jgi:hypothetical protein
VQDNRHVGTARAPRASHGSLQLGSYTIPKIDVLGSTTIRSTRTTASEWLQPTAILNPRLARFNATLSF